MNKLVEHSSMRYGGGSFDIRANFIRLCGWLQKRKIYFMQADPGECGQVLASSDVKGAFIEYAFATPAWRPIYSIESVDGEIWERLAADCKHVMGRIHWKERLSPIVQKQLTLLEQKTKDNPQLLITAETLSKFVARVLFELLFEKDLAPEDEDLFYRASLEWRKEIGIKGQGNPSVKAQFWSRLQSIVESSVFASELKDRKDEPGLWLSVFAQPFLISPQINISDIMVAVFKFLRESPELQSRAKQWAQEGDMGRINGILMESIRLQHPFPILERELQKNVKLKDRILTAGTQVFIFFDRFKQDKTFDPERWLKPPSENPYFTMPFGAGHRMCIGKPIATTLMTELLQGLLTRLPESQIQPSVGHLYSGRDNDQGGSVKEGLYQVKIFVRALWTSFKIGRGGKPEDVRCPFHRKPRVI